MAAVALPEYVVCERDLTESVETEYELVLTCEHIHRKLGSDSATVTNVTIGYRWRGMSEKPERKSDTTGEWRARTGKHRSIDTERLRTLDGTPGGEEGSAETIAGADPYNHATPPARDPTTRSTRRSLDDMRRLSESIKKSPFWNRSRK